MLIFPQAGNRQEGPGLWEARTVIDAIPAAVGQSLRSETLLCLPSTIVDALSRIPGEAGGRLGDPDAAVQQKVEFRS